MHSSPSPAFVCHNWIHPFSTCTKFNWLLRWETFQMDKLDNTTEFNFKVLNYRIKWFTYSFRALIPVLFFEMFACTRNKTHSTCIIYLKREVTCSLVPPKLLAFLQSYLYQKELDLMPKKCRTKAIPKKTLQVFNIRRLFEKYNIVCWLALHSFGKRHILADNIVAN